VKLYYTFKDEDHLYYVLELCPNGDLLNHLKQLGSLDLECTSFYMAELTSALEQLHSLNIIHRDLKPENILLDKDMHLKLTDFGTSKIISEQNEKARSNSWVGTAEYVSPELLNDKITYKSSDLWSLGCIVFQLICGRPPFRGLSEFLIFQKITAKEFTFPKGMPESAKDFIEKLLIIDPEKRLGAKDYKELKSHVFFKGINFETLSSMKPPTLKKFTGELVFVEDIIAEEEAKRKKISEEEGKKWKKFLMEDELILESGLVWKRKGRSVKKRQLILTNKPRIIYIDTKKNVQKGEVPWSTDIRPEARSKVNWFIHTPKRTYILEDMASDAERWVNAINKLLQEKKK